MRELQKEYKQQADHELFSVRSVKSKPEIALAFLRRKVICEKVLTHIKNRMDALGSLSAQFKANRSSNETIETLDKLLTKINEEIESKFLKKPLDVLQMNEVENEEIVALENELGIDHCNVELTNQLKQIINESGFEKRSSQNTEIPIGDKY